MGVFLSLDCKAPRTAHCETSPLHLWRAISRCVHQRHRISSQGAGAAHVDFTSRPRFGSASASSHNNYCVRSLLALNGLLINSCLEDLIACRASLRQRPIALQAFKGVWRMQQRQSDGSSSAARLAYALYVRPQAWLPVRLIQSRIEGEVVANLRAVQQHAERLHRNSALQQR